MQRAPVVNHTPDPKLLFWIYESEDGLLTGMSSLDKITEFQAKTKIMYHHIKHPFQVCSHTVDREKGGRAEEG